MSQYQGGFQQQPPPYPGGYGAGAPPPGFNVPPGQGGQYAGNAPPPTFVPPPNLAGYVSQPGGGEDGEFKSEYGFDDKTIRRGFIRKVFAIVAIQLMVVMGLIGAFIFNQDAKMFVQANRWTYYLSYGVFLVTYIALACCANVRRSFPANVICLALLTLAMGYMAAMISSFYDTNVVFMAMGICALCCFGVILFASQTRFDFTKIMGVMFVVGFVVVIFGFIAIICISVAGAPPILYIVYAGLMSLVLMVYLAIDIQLLMGGKKYEISPEDYIFAAAQIFLDIVQLFMLLLQIVGYAND